MTNTRNLTNSRSAAEVLLHSLDLLDDAPQAIEDAEFLTAAIREFAQRTERGIIDRDVRTELGNHMVALAEALNAYAIRVLA